jgi:aromatic-L-amino-acid decarboxylase
MAPTPFSVVCFRAHPKNINDEDELNALNEKLLDEINKTGKLFLSNTILNGKFVIRIAISGLRTQKKHVKKAWELISNV